MSERLEGLHPDVLGFVQDVSPNVSGPFVLLFEVGSRRELKNVHKLQKRAQTRLMQAGFYSAPVSFKGHHMLFCTRVADHLRIAKTLIGALTDADSPIPAPTLFAIDGIGYSGPSWYNGVCLSTTQDADHAIDRYIPAPAPHRAVVWPTQRLTKAWAREFSTTHAERAQSPASLMPWHKRRILPNRPVENVSGPLKRAWYNPARVEARANKINPN